jgi:CheY-like chemotaxis protein
MSKEAENSLRILVVDDHADTLLVLTTLLTRHGHAVQGALDFRSAVEIAQAGFFDLVICDIGLPDGDGCLLLNEFKKLYPIKAIAITGYECRATWSASIWRDRSFPIEARHS